MIPSGIGADSAAGTNGASPIDKIDDIDTSDITAAPPQPPLSASDDAKDPLPEIVHGIDMDNEDHNNQSQPHTPFLSHSGLSDALGSITERVQRAMRLTTGNPTSAPPPPPTIFLFGDSLTAYGVSTTSGPPGWGTLLRGDYATTADIIVRGHSGYNTRWALLVLPRELRAMLPTSVNAATIPSSPINTAATTTTTPLTPKKVNHHGHHNHIKLATIFFGANDACGPSSPQHVPLVEYSNNLTTMVSFFRSVGIPPLLITPPPIAPSCEIDGNRTPDSMARYAQACVSVAKRVNCPVIDIHTAFIQRAERDGAEDALEKLFVDGLHFSAEGNNLVYQLLVEKIASVAPDLSPATLTPFAPYYGDIDANDPTKSLGTSELARN